MQSRLKQLRMNFGLDRQAFADLLGCSAAEVEAWEKANTAPSDTVALIVDKFGVAPGWLMGENIPMWGERILDLQRSVSHQVNHLSGTQLVRILTATTGERIAFVIRFMQKAEPEMCTLSWAACWLGLTIESTQLVLDGRLDPGSPVVLRASDLTSVPERWFRQGPEE